MRELLLLLLMLPPLLLLLTAGASAASSATVPAAAANASSPSPSPAANASSPAANASSPNPSPAANASSPNPSPAANASSPSPSPAANATSNSSQNAVPERQCFFPFLLNGKWQHTCKKYDGSGDFWCSLSEDFAEGENWRLCHRHDLMRFQCQIPFKYKGQLHNKCLPLEAGAGALSGAHHGYWCSLEPEIGNWSWSSGDWAYCEREDATGIAYLKAVGSDKFPKEPVAGGGEAAPGAGKAAALEVGDGSDSNGASGQAAIGSGPVAGIAVGAVCAVLAVVAVLAAFGVRRRNRRRNGTLLPASDDRSGTYGGVEANGP